MAVTFDELGRLDAHGAVVGGEGLVELRHFAADGRRSLNQKDLETRGGEIERGLNAGDPATDDHDIAEIAISEMSGGFSAQWPSSFPEITSSTISVRSLISKTSSPSRPNRLSSKLVMQ